MIDKDIQAVVFDMDGVLFDTERLFMDAWRIVATKRQIPPERIEKVILGSVGLNMNDTKALFLRECGEDVPFDELFEACRICAEEMLEKDGLPMKPGVREILDYLKAAGYRIALASSTSTPRVMSHLERAGITGYFETVIGGDRVEHSKPQPDIYLIACRELDVEPENAVAIEDSPNGIRSAHAAGMHPIMVPDLIAPTPEIEALVDARCESLLEVKALFQEIPPKAGLQETMRILLEGLCNTRDLGGYRTLDGRKIKSKRLIRSGALCDAAGTDLEVLCKDYDLKTVVDFRTEAERKLKPDPQMQGVRYVENPILEEETLGITRENEETRDGNAVVKKVISTLHADGMTPLSYMEKMYTNLITNSFSRAQYKKFFVLLLEQKEGAVLWHCSAGKDRVGVATILLLSALGVPKEQIIADYVKVNRFVAKDVAVLMHTLTEGMDPSARETQVRMEAMRLLFTVDRAYAESVFAAMEATCGSVDAFLEKEMGLTDEKREALRDNYLEQ